jgi:hypothetical protein
MGRARGLLTAAEAAGAATAELLTEEATGVKICESQGLDGTAELTIIVDAGIALVQAACGQWVVNRAGGLNHGAVTAVAEGLAAALVLPVVEAFPAAKLVVRPLCTAVQCRSAAGVSGMCRRRRRRRGAAAADPRCPAQVCLDGDRDPLKAEIRAERGEPYSEYGLKAWVALNLGVAALLGHSVG